MKLLASELPIYEEPEELAKYEYLMNEPSKLELHIHDARIKTVDFLSQYQETFDKVNHVYETGIAHTKEAAYSIADENNVAARAGLITAGGVLGLLKARRGGIFKKLTYGSVGATAVAAAFYPRDAYNIGMEESVRLKKLALIAYNFALGAKPEEKKTTPLVTKELKTFEQDTKTPTSVIPTPVDVPQETASDPPAEEAEKSVVEDLATVAAVAGAIAAEVAETIVGSIDGAVASSQDDVIEVVPAASDEEISKDKVVKVGELPVINVEGDLGQGSPEDRELYTTRG